MAYKGLDDFIKVLEQDNDLQRIDYPVSIALEITEIADRQVKSGGPALLFTKNGSQFPLLINAFASDKRIAKALGLSSIQEVRGEVEKILALVNEKPPSLLAKIKLASRLKKMLSYAPKKLRGKGICQENIILSPDLSILPVLKCWPADGGPFITLPLVHTIDPETETLNVGMYRMQVLDNKTTAMHWHLHKDGASHFRSYQKQKKKMPVVVVLGGDPVYTYAATAPLPAFVNEYMFAGFLRKKSIRLVKAVTQPVYIPEDADIVLEGYVDPEETLVVEGPFGDHTGFYSLADKYPKFHLTAITYKNNAVYPATIVGVPPMEDAWLGKLTEQIFIPPLKSLIVPELVDMYMPVEGVFHNILIVKIIKSFPGQALKVMNALWGAGQMMFSKIIVVVDQHFPEIRSDGIFQEILSRVSIPQDIVFSKGPADVLDHAGIKSLFSGKIGIDATGKVLSNKPDLIKRKQIDTLPYSVESIEIKKCYAHPAAPELLLLTIAKKRADFMEKFFEWLSFNECFSGYRFFVLCDKEMDVQNPSLVLWWVSNHIDPGRDIRILKDENRNALIIDGTVKTSGIDSFDRDWPNPVAMDRETIERIDQIWNDLKIGEKITSPSIKIQSLLKGSGAVRSEKEFLD